MQFQKLNFKNLHGIRLAARLDLPRDQKPKAFAIFAHCFTCTKSLNPVVSINRELAMQGIAVLRFDFTGLGESEGDFSETNFSTNVTDLVSAAQFLNDAYEPPRLMIGHSFGGAAAIQAARKISSIEVVSTIAAPAELAGLFRFMSGAPLENIEKYGETVVDIAGRNFKIKKQFLEDLARQNLKEAVASLNKPVLIFHSPADEIVSIDQATKLFAAAKHPKSFVSLGGADHLLTSREDHLYVGRVMAAWASKYLRTSGRYVRPALSDDHALTHTGKTGFRTEITADGHSLVADEPIPDGGSDTGPTPYGLLISALGACTGMTLRMYADNKSLPLDAVNVRLKHRKIYSEDCKNCENPGSRIDFIEREIELQGDLDEPARQRLLDIANRCPVHRTLESQSWIASKLKE